MRFRDSNQPVDRLTPEQVVEMVQQPLYNDRRARFRFALHPLVLAALLLGSCVLLGVALMLLSPGPPPIGGRR